MYSLRSPTDPTVIKSDSTHNSRAKCYFNLLSFDFVEGQYLVLRGVAINTWLELSLSVWS